MRYINITSLLILLAVSSMSAQDDYQKWLQQEQAKFNKFISEEDQKFADFLRKEWVSVGLQKNKAPLVKPKPAHIPVVKDDTQGSLPPEQKKALETPTTKPVTPDPASEKNDSPKPERVTPQPVKEILAPAAPPAEPRKIEASIPAPEPAASSAPALSAHVAFYTSEQQFSFSPALRIKIDKPVSNEFFAEYWQAMSSREFKPVLAQAEAQRKKLHLNDWAYCNLLYDYANAVYPGDNNYRTLFTWYMLVKSGYRARTSYRDSEIFLLLATRNKLFGLPYFDGGPEARFYMVALQPGTTFKLDNIRVYREDFPGSEREFVFTINDLPKISDSMYVRPLELTVDGKKLSFSLLSNSGLINLYEYYPQTDYSVYFSAPLSPRAEASLLPQLREHCKGLQTRAALNFLLHFVQKATAYKIDDDQFGREKPLFVEESLRYPYSDCEDRSALYAYLVKKIVGLDVVGVYYPEHVATAVAMPEISSGDYIEFGNRKYLICDPTYLGADIGMCMPDYKGVNPEVIRW